MRVCRKRHRPERELVREEVVPRRAEQAEHLRDRVRVPERHRRDVPRGAVVERVEVRDDAQDLFEPGAVAVLHRRAEELGGLCVVGDADGKGLGGRGGAEGTPGGDDVFAGCEGRDFKVDSSEGGQAGMGVACAFVKETALTAWIEKKGRRIL